MASDTGEEHAVLAVESGRSVSVLWSPLFDIVLKHVILFRVTINCFSQNPFR